MEIPSGGMTGKYIGLGYSVEMYSKFVEDSEIYEIINYSFRIFGIEILKGVNE